MQLRRPCITLVLDCGMQPVKSLSQLGDHIRVLWIRMHVLSLIRVRFQIEQFPLRLTIEDRIQPRICTAGPMRPGLPAAIVVIVDQFVALGADLAVRCHIMMRCVHPLAIIYRLRQVQWCIPLQHTAKNPPLKFFWHLHACKFQKQRKISFGSEIFTGRWEAQVVISRPFCGAIAI